MSEALKKLTETASRWHGQLIDAQKENTELKDALFVEQQLVKVKNTQLEVLQAENTRLGEALKSAKACMERDKNGGYRMDYNGQPAHEIGSTYLKVCEALNPEKK